MRCAIVFSALTFAGCSSYAPDAGHEVVLIEKPMFFGHGGVEAEPVKTGRTFTAATTRASMWRCVRSASRRTFPTP